MKMALIVLSIVGVLFFGLRWLLLSDELQNRRKNAEIGTSASGNEPIDKPDAVRIGNKYFSRPEGSGVYVGDRGAYFLVAPPAKTIGELERSGIWLRKCDGVVFTVNPND